MELTTPSISSVDHRPGHSQCDDRDRRERLPGGEVLREPRQRPVEGLLCDLDGFGVEYAIVHGPDAEEDVARPNAGSDVAHEAGAEPVREPAEDAPESTPTERSPRRRAAAGYAGRRWCRSRHEHESHGRWWWRRTRRRRQWNAWPVWTPWSATDDEPERRTAAADDARTATHAPGRTEHNGEYGWTKTGEFFSFRLCQCLFCCSSHLTVKL